MLLQLRNSDLEQCRHNVQTMKFYFMNVDSTIVYRTLVTISLPDSNTTLEKRMDLGLAGKTAIITGAAGGIGAAIAERFCTEGANVVVADIDESKAAARVGSLKQSGARVLAVQTDVTDERSVEMLVNRAHEAFGSVHVLVNNAGFTRDMRITKMTERDWDAVIDVTLKGAFFCTRAVIGHFAAQNWGRVIGISSRAHLGNPGQANYSAAKAGLIGFTKSMALENGRFNITVNAVAPGLVDTEMVRSHPHFDKLRAAAEKNTPIPRLGQTEDVADAVAFLASERAGYITGEVLHVTGGRY